MPGGNPAAAHLNIRCGHMAGVQGPPVAAARCRLHHHPRIQLPCGATRDALVGLALNATEALPCPPKWLGREAYQGNKGMIGSGMRLIPPHAHKYSLRPPHKLRHTCVHNVFAARHFDTIHGSATAVLHADYMATLNLDVCHAPIRHL